VTVVTDVRTVRARANHNITDVLPEALAASKSDTSTCIVRRPARPHARLPRMQPFWQTKLHNYADTRWRKLSPRLMTLRNLGHAALASCAQKRMWRCPAHHPDYLIAARGGVPILGTGHIERPIRQAPRLAQEVWSIRHTMMLIVPVSGAVLCENHLALAILKLPLSGRACTVLPANV